MSLRNERDQFVTSNPPRLLPVGVPPNTNIPGLKALILTSTSISFKMNVDNEVVGPSQITINALLRAITGTPTFTVTSGSATLSAGSNPNQRVLNFSNMNTDVITITCTVEDTTTFRPNGTEPLEVFTDVITISKIQDGSIGARGAGHYYAFGNSWNNTTATTATPDGLPVVDDLVTIANGTTYALTKRWNGSAWVNIGKVIDGNLLVTGSVNSAAINTNGLTIRDPSGNIILDAGGGEAIDYTKVGGTKPPPNATRNAIWRQGTSPATAINGDIWIHTGVTPNQVWIMESGNWRTAASMVTSTNQITDGAGLGTTAVWNSVSGTGKPEDGATQNLILTGTTVPSSGLGSNGDIYIRSRTDFPSEEYIKVSGSWRLAATINERITTTNAGTYIAPGGIPGTYIQSLTADKLTTGLLSINDVGVNGLNWQDPEWGSLNAPFILNQTNPTNHVGLKVFKSANSKGSAIYGEASSTSNAGAGICGVTYKTASDSRWGVVGWHFATSNSANCYGVGGYTRSTAAGAAGGHFAGLNGTNAFAIRTGYAGTGGKIYLGDNGTSIGGMAVFSIPNDSSNWFVNTDSSSNFRIYRNGTSTGIYIDNTGKLFAPVGVGPFTGQHITITQEEDITENSLGDIVCDLPFIFKIDVSNAITSVSLSTTPNDKKAIGVVAFEPQPIPYLHEQPTTQTVSTDPFDPTKTTEITVEDSVRGPESYGLEDDTLELLRSQNYKWLTINSLGEGLINVCGEGGDIEIGDYIVSSSIPGKGMKQADDIYRNYTVAKSRENVTFSSPTEVKQIACIYLCG